MKPRPLIKVLLIAIFLAGCSGLKFGSDFDLVRFIGEPHQVGLDTGDPTWGWTYVQAFANQEFTKQHTVRLDERGAVKSYSFTSSLPEHMPRLK